MKIQFPTESLRDTNATACARDTWLIFAVNAYNYSSLQPCNCLVYYNQTIKSVLQPCNCLVYYTQEITSLLQVSTCLVYYNLDMHPNATQRAPAAVSSSGRYVSLRICTIEWSRKTLGK